MTDDNAQLANYTHRIIYRLDSVFFLLIIAIFTSVQIAIILK